MKTRESGGFVQTHENCLMQAQTSCFNSLHLLSALCGRSQMPGRIPGSCGIIEKQSQLCVNIISIKPDLRSGNMNIRRITIHPAFRRLLPHGLQLLCIAALCLAARHTLALPPEVPEATRSIVAEANGCKLTVIDSPTRGIFLTPTSVRNNSDPRDHQPYHSAIHVYVSGKGLPDGPSDGYIERFVIYGAADTPSPLMISTARLLLALWGQAWSHLHRDHPVDTPVAQVWMDPLKGSGLSPDVAGEQFKNQIYLYSVGTERRPIEWLREIAHEYGHFSLPGISGYTDPEEWANGVLGERLYLNWMFADINKGVLKASDLPFASAAELTDYVQKQIEPVKALAAHGVSRETMRRKDAMGMDAYTGLALWIDDTYGSQQLVSAMSYTAPKSSDRLPEGEDFLDGYIQSVKSADRLTLTIRPLVAIPEKASFVIYLDTGTYRLGASQPFSSFQAQLRSTVVRGEGVTSLLQLPAAGWYQFQVRFMDSIRPGTTFTLTRSQ
jgi:hypothetical protein